jgi:regulator of sirC expression with transglutaminase-like and TPR domain
MELVLRLNSSKYSDLVISDYEVPAVALALAAEEILSEGILQASKTQRRLNFLLHELISVTSAALNNFLFRNKQFKSSSSDAQEHAPQLFVGKTLEAREGHPLIMSLIYRDLARRFQKAPINLMNFPGFFFIKVLYQHQLLFLDPGDGGRVLATTELQEKLAHKFGKTITLNGVFLETPSEIQTITRYLSKLKNIYSLSRNWRLLLTTLDMLIATNPHRIGEYRERGMLLYQLGAYAEALRDLNLFIEKSAPSPEVEKIKNFLGHAQHPNVTPIF